MRKTLLVLITGMSLAAAVAAQTRLDGILLKFGGDVITDSDVRQARLLKLVDASADGDQAFVDALVNRRLMLVEIKRTPAPEPSAGAVEARTRQWTSRLPAGTDVSALLARAGLNEAGLQGWLRDDLRIEAYLDQRFSGRPDRAREVAAWIAELRQRVGLR